MSFDEASSVHERLMATLRDVLADAHLVERVDGEVVFGVLYYAWVVVGVPIVLVLGGFLRDLPRPAGQHFVLAAAVYLSGAIGCELLGGRQAEQHGRENWTYTLISTGEETLEMLGIIIFIWAPLRYCAANGACAWYFTAEVMDGSSHLATPHPTGPGSARSMHGHCADGA